MAPRAASRASLLLPFATAAVLLLSTISSASALAGEVCTTFSSMDNGGCTRNSYSHYSRHFTVTDGGVLRGFTARTSAYSASIATYVGFAGVGETQCDWVGGSGMGDKVVNCPAITVPAGQNVYIKHTSLATGRLYTSGAPCSNNGEAAVSFEVCRPAPSSSPPPPPPSPSPPPPPPSPSPPPPPPSPSPPPPPPSPSPPPPPPSPSPPPSSSVQLERALTAGRAFPTLLPDSETTGALRISVTAAYTEVESTWRTLFNFSGVACTFHASSINVAAPAAPELVVPNFLSFSNQNGASVRCSQGVYMTSASPGYASWPRNTPATLTFDIDALGNVGVPAIDGVPFELVPFPMDDTWVPACATVRLAAAEALYLGASSGEAGDDFVGDITNVTITRVGVDE
jgi:hypothetical protein